MLRLQSFVPSSASSSMSSSALTTSVVSTVGHQENDDPEKSASMNLLLRFQRLLIAQLYSKAELSPPLSTGVFSGESEFIQRTLHLKSFLIKILEFLSSFFFSFPFSDLEIHGIASLLKKFLNLLCTHVVDCLTVAVSMATISIRHFAMVTNVIQTDITGLYSFLTF